MANIAASAGITVIVLSLTVAARPIEAQDEAVRVRTSLLDRYVGEYVYPDGGVTIMIRRRGDTLYRETPGHRLALIPISETRFTLGPVFTAEFLIDQTGGVTQVISDGIGTEFRLPRKTPGAAAPRAIASPVPALAAAHVNRSVLERYVGEYEFVPGQMSRTDLIILVRLRGDTLTRQISTGPEVVLTPISETRFRVGNTSAEAEFVIDPAGRVTQVMGSGSQRMLANRKLPR